MPLMHGGTVSLVHPGCHEGNDFRSMLGAAG